MKDRLTLVDGIPPFLEKEIDDFIIKELGLEDQVKGLSVTSDEIMSLFVSDLCYKNHVHTIHCMSKTEAFNPLNKYRRWNINLSNLNREFYIAYYTVAEVGTAKTTKIVNNRNIDTIEGNILGYLLNKANGASQKYLGNNHKYSSTLCHIGIMSQYDWINSDYANKTKPNTIDGIFRLENDNGVARNLYIDNVYSNLCELPCHINSSFINHSDLLVGRKDLENSIVKDSSIDYSTSHWFDCYNNSNYYKFQNRISFIGNEVYSSNLHLFTPSEVDIPPSMFFIYNCNFYNSVIKIRSPFAGEFCNPIKFIFNNCNFNNTVITNLAFDLNNVKVEFEYCRFTYSNIKFEIEKMI